MEGKTKVKVKFGRTMYRADGEATDADIHRANDDAVTRLVTRFPLVEDILIDTRVFYSTYPDRRERRGVQASASGYVPNDKNSTSYIIKDITSTRLYKGITDIIKSANATVVAYDFSYNNSYRVRFSGKGDIPWEKLKDAINTYNQEQLNTSKRGKYLFIINLNEVYWSITVPKGYWTGDIILSDGSWIKLKRSYDGHGKSYYTRVVRYSQPELDMPDSNFDVTFHKGD